jgi:branched-chain amino acid aminotransferase
MITCRPVRFRPFARFYAEGVELQTPPISVPVQGGIDPRIKTHSRLLFALGAVAVAEPDRSVLPLFTDVEGHITETSSTNVFFVRGTQVLTPPDASVLGGITRRVVLDLAAAQGLQPSARHVRLNELDQFDEAFITATSFAILPVRRINAKHFAPIPGPVTTQLTAAFSSLVGLDIPQQAQLAAAAEAGAPKEPPGKIRRVERGSRP